jgi:hypothetical protein
MLIEISKKIEIRNTGVFLTYHAINPNMFYNSETKTVQANLVSSTQKDKSPIKNARIKFQIKAGEDIETSLVNYINDNLDFIINGPMPKNQSVTNIKKK